MTGPLGGLRVLDLADRSAALAGRVLADLGAQVIMVEPPEGNPIRRHAPFIDAAQAESAAHLYFSANKRSVRFDIASEPDRFVDLVATADVVIDTERPGRLSELGLGHERLRAANPRLIQCSVTPFGLDGEWRDWTGADLIAGAAGGLIWLSGERQGTPVQGGADVAYAMAGLIAASAISIALHHRTQGAGGTHIDISLQEAAAAATMQTATGSRWFWHDRVPRRPGLSSAMRCADGGFVGHLVRPDRFDAFLAWADREGIDHGMGPDDWRHARLDAPRKGNPVAEATLALAAKLGRDEFAAGALEADLICLPVLGFDDLAQTEQYRVNDQFLTVDHPRLGELGFVRSPVDGAADGVAIVAAPDLGADQDLLDSTVASTDCPDPTAVVSATTPDPARALAGIRVVDFSWVLAGPIGTRILASFGAEVIRIESSTKPDSMRSQIGPDGVPDPELGGLFNSVNAGKKSLAVDVSTPAGQTLVKDLIATADVVVNNFRPGALDRMGFGFDELRRIKPDIVLANLPGAHPHGPWAGRPTMGNILMAASGFNMLTGFPDERPRGVGVAYPDFTSPHLLVAAVLAALRARNRDGQARRVDLTQLSGMVSLLGAEWLRYRATGQVPPRRANRDPNYCPHGVFPAAATEHSDDEWIAIAIGDDDEWRALAGMAGIDPADERFASHRARTQNHDALDSLIAEWTGGLDKWKLAERLQQAGVAAAPVEHLADMATRDPQLRHRYQFVRQPARPGLDIPIEREPARWVGRNHPLTRSPGLGEHAEQIVCGLLGRTPEQFATLLTTRVLT